MSDGPPTESDVPPIGHAILQALLYADVFDYPLTADEIHRYLPGVPARAEAVRALLSDGFARGVLVEGDGLFALAGRAEVIALRQRRARIAQRMWRRARWYGYVIAHLPFVRLVAVTGTLAVGNVEPTDDIDLFIVTAPGRLWLCRALVIGVVRLARLFGDELCPNYLVTEQALVIHKRNLFTARELAQMVPLFGSATYQRLRDANRWVLDFLPNAELPPPGTRLRDVGGWPARLKALGERVLSGWLGDRLERWEQERKIAQLSRQAAAMGNGTAAVFTPDCCKGHFEAYDRVILERFEERLEAYGVARSEGRVRSGE